jgi:hypothetical protein
VRQGEWRLNTTLLQDETHTRFHRQWKGWTKRIPKYRNILEWWDAYAKVRIQKLFQEEGRETARERRNIEQFYYTCIYDLLRETPGDP